MNKKNILGIPVVDKYQFKKDLLEQFPAKMLGILFNFFGKMFQELIHLLAFMLHDAVSNVRCLIIGVFKLMILQAADFFGLFLCDVSVVGKNRGKYTS